MSRNDRLVNGVQLPEGYEAVRFAPEVRLALPVDVAAAARADLAQREVAAEAARCEALSIRHEAFVAERQADAASGTSGPQAFRRSLAAPPPPGWYRVLPDLAALTGAGRAVGLELSSTDEGVNKRHADLREALIAKGPDRRIARSDTWRRDLDELDQALPHFRAPIQLLRSALSLADATGRPVRLPPMLLLGPPGVGKTYFSQRVSGLLSAPHATIAFDQPSAGAQLRGSDKYWANSSVGLLFNLVALGDFANPVVLLDELDKSMFSAGGSGLDPLGQLHGALEPETSRRTMDLSVEIEFDASLVTYIATANSVRRLDAPLISRMQVFDVQPPRPSEAVGIAQAVAEQVLGRLGLGGSMKLERRALYLLAHMSARMMVRAVEQAVAAAVGEQRELVLESDIWRAARLEDSGPRLH